MKKYLAILLLFIVLASLLSGCGFKALGASTDAASNGTGSDAESNGDGSKKGDLSQIKEGEHYTINKDGEVEITEEQMYKILKDYGYGEGVDWSEKSDDDPSIPKSMDITASRELMEEAFYKKYKKAHDYEPGEMYEKAWWDYFPDDYDISGDVFPATKNYAGEEKQYNNSLEQHVVSDDGYTTGQDHDLSNAQNIAQTFIYEEMKGKYKWTDNLDKLCMIADGLEIADFYSKQSEREYLDGDKRIVGPGFMSAHYHTSTVGYDLIGLPKFGGYEFTITVWEKKDEPVGWVNELDGGKFLNDKEVYENMGEWDFYDELDAVSWPTKVVKPKLPNGAMMIRGKTDDLSKEQYVYKKLSGGSGTIYYYGNGVTVDMTFYGKEQGGNFKDALKYCQTICHNKNNI